MSRTPEQVAATNAFEEALNEVLRAYGLTDTDDPLFMVTDYVVLGATSDQEGTGTFFLTDDPEGGKPPWKVRGLLTEHLADMNRMVIVQGSGEDDD